MDCLEEILAKPKLPEVVGRYLDYSAKALAEKYEQFRRRLSARRFVVPVAGVQGSGKSTLLNAIAFDTPVLPIDADETTCVPVEITYAERLSGHAVVRHAEGREERIPATEESLADFVHNHRNPANQRRVDRVIVESNRPLLQHGLVLVDLPGTGSLTTSNIETMCRYLDESVGVVFLLRTVPPLTRSESFFVASHWKRLPTAFFVQNRWTDERIEEVEAGRQHNLLVLKQLAARNRIPLDGDPVIHVVNAYQALHGRLTGDTRHLEASGLDHFESDLEARAREWPMVLRVGIVGAVRGNLQAALANVERQIGELHADRATGEAKLKTETERFQKYIDELERVYAGTCKDIEFFSSDRHRDIEDWCREAASALRNAMRTKFRQGIVDGPHLSRALLDEESGQADRIFEKVQEEVLTFEARLRERFQDIREWRLRETGFRVGVDREERRKWESLAKPLLGVGGSLAGFKAGASLGAALGFAGGPLGSGVGAVVGGVIGGLFGAWAGKKVRHQVIVERARAAQPEVFRAIDRFVDGTRSALLRQLEEFQEHLLKGLGDWIEAQRSSFEVVQKKTLKDLGATKREREVCLGKLATDAAQLKKWLAALEVEAT